MRKLNNEQYKLLDELVQINSLVKKQMVGEKTDQDYIKIALDIIDQLMKYENPS